MMKSKKSIIFLALCFVMQQAQVLHANTQQTFFSNIKHKISQLSTAKKIGVSIASLIGASLLGVAWYFKPRTIQSMIFPDDQEALDVRCLGLVIHSPRVNNIALTSKTSYKMPKSASRVATSFGASYTFDGNQKLSIHGSLYHEDDDTQHTSHHFQIIRDSRIISSNSPDITPCLKAKFFQELGYKTFKHTDNNYYLIADGLVEQEQKITADNQEHTVYTASLQNLNNTKCQTKHAYLHFYCYDKLLQEIDETQISIEIVMAYISNSKAIEIQRFNRIKKTTLNDHQARDELHNRLWTIAQNTAKDSTPKPKKESDKDTADVPQSSSQVSAGNPSSSSSTSSITINNDSEHDVEIHVVTDKNRTINRKSIGKKVSAGKTTTIAPPAPNSVIDSKDIIIRYAWKKYG